MLPSIPPPQQFGLGCLSLTTEWALTNLPSTLARRPACLLKTNHVSPQLPSLGAQLLFRMKSKLHRVGLAVVHIWGLQGPLWWFSPTLEAVGGVLWRRWGSGREAQAISHGNGRFSHTNLKRPHHGGGRLFPPALNPGWLGPTESGGRDPGSPLGLGLRGSASFPSPPLGTRITTSRGPATC